MNEKKVTYLDAIRQAIREEMHRDDAVFLLREDLGADGRLFNVSEEFLEEFGPERVIDIPMADGAIIGSAIGAALTGLRPIAGMPFVDFIDSGFEQLLNLASGVYWPVGYVSSMSSISMPGETGMAPVPIVFRGPSGGETRDDTPLVSVPETWFLRTSGMKVVAPSTTYDAKGLFKAAVRDDNPVLYLEHRLLYRLPGLREELPAEDFIVPLGKAIIRRNGEDMTMVSYGVTVHQCLHAARTLEREDNLEAEVLDLRSLIPLDRDTILESVKRTNKVLIVHEDSLTGSMGAELADMLADDLLEYLDGPLTRVATSGMPFPYTSSSESAYLPGTRKIISAAKKLAAY